MGGACCSNTCSRVPGFGSGVWVARGRIKMSPNSPRLFSLRSNSAACSSAVRKPAISLADSTDLRYGAGFGGEADKSFWLALPCFFSSVPEPKLLGVEWVNGRQAVVVANEAFPQSTGCWKPP